MSATMEALADPLDGRKTGAIEPRGDADSRLASVVVAGAGPGLSTFGDRRLFLDLDGADLRFLQSGRAPLLVDHCRNIDSQIGIVTTAGVADGLLWAEVRFARTPYADDVFQRVWDGVLRNISVGMAYYPPAGGGERAKWINRWQPYEVSVVTVPADWRAHILSPDDVPPDLVALARAKVRAAACGSPATWRAWPARAAPALADRLGCDPALAGGALAEAIEAELRRAADEAAP